MKLCDKMVKNRIKYIDTLKFLAIFGVIVIHASYIGENSEILNLSIVNFQQIVRFAVPVFLMVSGSLLLNKEIDLRIFLKKRLTRIIYPWIFFTFLICILGLSDGIANILCNYWYALLCIGLYLTIPIINKFIQNASPKEMNYYLILILLSSILYQSFRILNLKYSIDILFFLSPISYLFLGYYFFNKEFNKNPKHIILISLCIFIISTYLKMITGNLFTEFTTLQTYIDIGFLQIAQACSVFIIIKYVYCSKNNGILLKIRNLLESNYISRFINSIGRSSYGMYLIQNIFLNKLLVPILTLWPLTGTQTCLIIILVSISIFLISWIITLILSKIPYLKICSGYY